MSGGCQTRTILLVAGCLLLARDITAQSLDLKVALDGPSVYKAYCAACHGADGRGRGPAAEAMKNRPTDLTTIAKRNGGIFPSSTIEGVLQSGEKWKAHGSKEMPVWGPIFVAVDRNDRIAYAHLRNLIVYLESIQVQ